MAKDKVVAAKGTMSTKKPKPKPKVQIKPPTRPGVPSVLDPPNRPLGGGGNKLDNSGGMNDPNYWEDVGPHPSAPQQGANVPGGGKDDDDDEDDLQAQQNAADVLIALFKTYGLDSLAPEIINMVKRGVTDAASVTLLLSETDAYKKRFAANEARKQKGMKVYSPAEYLDLEESFRKVLIYNGLPNGFYDQPSDFQEWIAGDVSPDEINDRISIANDKVLKSDPFYVDALERMGLNTGDMVAAVLDLKRAFPVLKKMTLSAQIGAEASRSGLSWSKERAEYLQGLGITNEQARQGFGMVASNLETAQRLGARFGENYGQHDLEDDLLVESGVGRSSQKRRRISGWEQGMFSGSSGVGKGSFASKNKGEY